MALSTLIGSSKCMNRVLGSQVLRLASRPAPILRMVTNESSHASTLNAVRALRTSAVHHGAAGSDHSKIWLAEKVLSLILIPLVPAALLYPSRTLDTLLAVALVAHTHWGFEAIAVDYVRPILFGPFLPKVAVGLVYLLSFATLGGLLYIIQHDIGIANTIRKVWAVQPAKN